MELAMQPFYNAIRKNEFELYKKNLLDRDSASHESALPDVGKVVFIYETREDIAAFCRKEEERIERITGIPRRIRDDSLVAVFRWNKKTGMVAEEPLSEESWQRFFKMDLSLPCIIC